MANDHQQAQHRPVDIERNAYNAAFYELGLRWHWDSDTYDQLLRHGQSPAARIHHYLETRQPHLLKAYDAHFLAEAIEDKVAGHARRDAQGRHACQRHFDWSRTVDGELGA